MQRLLLHVAAALLLASPALAADLPDPRLTPGVVRSDIDLGAVCSTRWGKDARSVTAAMKREVLRRYGMTPDQCPSGRIEIDHLIGRELAGADEIENLWSQCYEKKMPGTKPSETREWGAYKKDRLENFLHRSVCSGVISIGDAQRELRDDWIASYIRHFGRPSGTLGGGG